MQFVTLLFNEPIQPDFGVIKERIAEILDQEIDSSPIEEAKHSFLVFYKEQVIQYADKAAPAQTAFMIPEDEEATEGYSEQIEQSWCFPEAARVVKQAKFSLSVVEFLASGLDPKTRLKLFHAALQAAVEECSPIALVFTHSCQVVEPHLYLSKCSDSPELRPGSINIRLYNISNSNGEMVMDSRGLEEIGLPDVQCHFKNMDPNDVSGVLYNIVLYIVENGPVIESGNTIQGRTEEEKWLCQYEDALIKPSRNLIDLNPGPEHAAGNRRA